MFANVRNDAIIEMSLDHQVTFRAEVSNSGLSTIIAYRAVGEMSSGRRKVMKSNVIPLDRVECKWCHIDCITTVLRGQFIELHVNNQ